MSLLFTLMELDRLYESTEFHDDPKLNDYAILKQTYKTYNVFNDRNKESGHIVELLDELIRNDIPYEQYVHKTDNGITIFHD